LSGCCSYWASFSATTCSRPSTKGLQMKLSRPSVGLAVRAAREAAGLTLKDLAGMTEIPVYLLSRTELGERDLGYTELLAVIDAVKIDEIVLRDFAATFERDGVAEKRQVVRDLNELQREAIAALIGTRAGLRR
jgi:transcriptional regulator with XRE-family HTH domain